MGAIQAQLLNNNNAGSKTSLNTATNTLFLVGILFNVIGAYFALTAASSLDTNINDIELELPNLKDEPNDTLSAFAKEFTNADRAKRAAKDNKNINFERICQSIRRFEKVGRLAYCAISLGFLSCPAALCCLAYDQGLLAMKIAAPAVVASLLILAFACSVIYRRKTDYMW